MKGNLLIICLVLFYGHIYSQSDDNEYFKKNNIKQVKTMTYVGDENSTPIVNVSTYNKQGFKISSITYEKNNIIHSKFEYLYDDKSNRTLTIENGKRDKKNEYHYKYSNNGKILEIWSKSFIDKYLYSAENNVVKITHTNKDEKETKEIFFDYDANGNQISEYVKGKPFHLNSYKKYDKYNNIIEELTYYHADNHDELYSSFSYIYNDNKQLISKNFKGGYFEQNNEKYTYYPNSQLHIVEVENENRTEYFYNDKNLIIQKKTELFKYKLMTIINYEYQLYE